MQSSWRQQDLPEIVTTLARRPGHELVRTLVADILRYGFGAAYHAIDHEVRMPEVRGRADALFGATVFEIKKDFRQEIGDARGQLERVSDGARGPAEPNCFLGIATDGATFVAFELRGGALVEISRHEAGARRPPKRVAGLARPRRLHRQTDLLPEPLIVQRELGREQPEKRSGARRSGPALDRLAAHPEVALKRKLWDGFLREVYATSVGDNSLFLQHTYLTIVAKTVAARVLDVRRIDDAGGDPVGARAGRYRHSRRGGERLLRLGGCSRRTAPIWCCGSRDRLRASACATPRSTC